MKKSLYLTSSAFLKKKMKEKPILSFLIFLVLFCHLGVFIYAQINPVPRLNPNRKKLIVKTHVLPPEVFNAKQLTNKQLHERQTERTSSPKKASTSSSSTTKKNSAPAAAKTQKTTKTTPTTKKGTIPDEKAKKLLHDLQESLAKIETSKETLPSREAMIIPQSIKELKADSYQIVTDETSQEGVFYQDILINYLKDALQLPAYGTVKIALTLSSQGTAEQLLIVYSDSEVNRFYLEKQLKDLSFPPFTAELANKKTFTFSLTFCSDQ